MIVSTQEITRVIMLSTCDPGTGVAVPAVCDPAAPSAHVAHDVTARPAAGQDRDFRLSRVRCLRLLLHAGTYSVLPEQVATKMIGRAICDQVAHLVDE